MSETSIRSELLPCDDEQVIDLRGGTLSQNQIRERVAYYCATGVASDLFSDWQAPTTFSGTDGISRTNFSQVPDEEDFRL